MNKTSSLVQKGVVSLIVFVQLFGFSLAGYSRNIVLAQEVVCPAASGNSAPTGSSSFTFSYNPTTCLWENDYYAWDPITKIYSPKYDQTPVLNSDGTAWEYPQWTFVASSGAYVLRIISEPIPVPAITESSAPGVQTSTTPEQEGTAGAHSATTGGNTISNTGALSDNNIDSNTSMDAEFDITNNTSILSVLNSNASSGNANVLQNTYGGSATTGDATAIANYLNMIQSGWSPLNGSIGTFSADLYGTITSDLLFNPNSILSTGASSNNNINNENDSNLKVNVEENASIVNDINLDVQSGDATVSENTNAGDATTGDATAVANIINMINSTINSPNSFVGNINIYGDLDGDLLLPASVLAELQRTGAYSQNSITNSNESDTDIDVNKYSSITNNIDLSAESGNATVVANTNAGDPTTGDASTGALQKNFIGVNGGGTSGLLVFVNVLGKWIGMVIPVSSSIADTGAESNNAINNSNSSEVDMNYDQNYQITNNINANAKSGDATVSKNTNAGNATSGDASAAANVLNVIDSNLEFTNWFGVLFINVFGSWNGSFGVNTSAGGNNPTTSPTSGSSVTGGNTGAAGSSSVMGYTSVPVIATESSAGARQHRYIAGATSSIDGTGGSGGAEGQVIAMADGVKNASNQNSSKAVSTINSSNGAISFAWWAPVVLLTAGGVLLARRKDVLLFTQMILKSK